MSEHVTIEDLSAYLDRQLTRAELLEIEKHLAECELCAKRCDGMRRVMSSLKHLEHLAPPSTLDQTVARRIALTSERVDLYERLESSLSIFERQSSLLALFAVVIALAVIMLLFSVAVERAQHATIPVVFQDPDFRGEESLGDAAHSTRLEIAGRVLIRDGDAWIEEGVDPARVDRVLEADSAAARELITQHPELAELDSLDLPAIIALNGEIVELCR